MGYELSFKKSAVPSAWKSMEAWREKQRAYSENFQATMALASDSLLSTAVTNAQSTGELAAKQALTRIQKDFAAKQAAAAKASGNNGYNVLEGISSRFQEITLSTTIGKAVDLSV